MPFDSFPSVFMMAAFSVLSASLIVLGLGQVMSGRRPATRAMMRDSRGSAVFLFDDRQLVDATPQGRQLLRHGDRRLTDWDALMGLLSLRFPNLRERLDSLAQAGEVAIDSDQRDSTLRAEFWDGMVRLSLQEETTAESPLDHLRLEAMQDEVETLRSIADDAPQLIWKQSASGQVSWANHAYLSLAERYLPPGEDGAPAWPLTPIFPDPGPELTDSTPAQRRLRLDDRAGKTEWYDVTTVRRGPETVHFAIDASAAMEAENGRRIFIQTLTKTFANLATGLAIFDRQRRLQLFNPAFLDLTGLSVGFLSARPHVHSVLDRMRDMNLLPEPKHYASWRDRVTALESAAERGTYCESWSLPSGQTYRVTGRPHPDGAIALLFEDISDEISLTRHFRAEQEVTRAVLDSMQEGVAVFSPAGTMILTNALYDTTWGVPQRGLADIRLDDEAKRWQLGAAPTALWPALADFAGRTGEQVPLRETIRLTDGRALTVRVVRLTGGSTLIGFGPVAAEGGAAKMLAVGNKAPRAASRRGKSAAG